MTSITTAPAPAPTFRIEVPRFTKAAAEDRCIVMVNFFKSGAFGVVGLEVVTLEEVDHFRKLKTKAEIITAGHHPTTSISSRVAVEVLPRSEPKKFERIDGSGYAQWLARAAGCLDLPLVKLYYCRIGEIHSASKDFEARYP